MTEPGSRPKALRHKNRGIKQEKTKDRQTSGDHAPNASLREQVGSSTYQRNDIPGSRSATPDSLYADPTKSMPRNGSRHTTSQPTDSVRTAYPRSQGTSRTEMTFRERAAGNPELERIRWEGSVRSETSTVSSSSSLHNPVPNKTPTRASSTSSRFDDGSGHRSRRASTATSAAQSSVTRESDGPGGGGVRLSAEDIVELRRAGSQRRAPEQIPRRYSRSSRSSSIPQQGNTNGAVQPQRQGSEDARSSNSRRTDSSLSNISRVTPQEPRRTALNRIFGFKAKAKGKTSEDKEEVPGKREETKKKLIEGLKKVKDVTKPIGHDVVENTAHFGRMVVPIAMFLAPAALMTLYAWDALQFVEDNKQDCKDLIENAIVQHEGLLDLVKRCKLDRDLTEENIQFMERAMKQHGDACQAVYDAVLVQKKKSFIKRFITRKQIKEKHIASAKFKLQDAMQEYLRALSTMTWVNTADNSNLLRENQEILKAQQESLNKVLEMLGKLMVLLDESSAESLARKSRSSLGSLVRDNTEWESRIARILKEREQAEFDRQREEKVFFERLNGFLDARETEVSQRKGTRNIDKVLGLVLDELFGTDESPAKTIEEIRKTKRTDEGRFEQLKRAQQSGRLGDEEAVELETLGVRLKVIDKFLPILEVVALPPEGTAPGRPCNNFYSEDTMNLLSRRIRRKISAGGRGSASRDGFELIIDDDASQERSDAKDARDYQDLLVLHYPQELKRALFTPSPVHNGDVGRIKDGKFEYLFSIISPGSERALRHLKPITFKPEDLTTRVKPIANKGAVTKRTKRAFIVRHTESIDRLSKQFEQPIKKIRNYGSSRDRRAILVVDDPEYKRIISSKHDAVKNWLTQSMRTISEFLVQKNIQLREDESLHLVTGVLRAKHWALLLTHKTIEEKIYFCEFDKVRSGTAWGTFSLEKSLDLDPGEDADQYYTSKVSPYGSKRKDAVLLATMRFRPDSGTREERHHESHREIRRAQRTPQRSNTQDSNRRLG
ncbi:hypothetical protein ACEPAF_8081 [Sanghuangporus sanghuang]